MLQTTRCGGMLAHNIRNMPASQPSTGLSLSVFSWETAEARSRPFSGKGTRQPKRSGRSRPLSTKGPGAPRRSPISRLGCGSSVAQWSASTSRAGTRTLARSAATAGSGPPKRHPRCRSNSSVRRAPGSPSPVDEDLGLKYLMGPAARSALLCHADRRSRNP